MTSRLHVVAGAQSRFVRSGLTPGQRPDAPQALPLREGLAPACVVADRGYDSDPLAASAPSFRPGASTATRGPTEAARYAQRHLIERLFSRLQQFRRLAIRYEKLDAHFLAFIHLSANVL